jgi:hypothetical protein
MRIGIFIDGGFLEVIRDACHFDEQAAPTLSQFVAMVRSGVARSYGIQPGQVDVVGMHWFRGQFPKDPDNRTHKEDPRVLYARTIRDQRLVEELNDAGIKPHGRTVYKLDACPACGKTEFCEKGIDTLILADALDFAVTSKPDGLVLVGSDGDHITLLERMEERGIQTILVYYNSPDVPRPVSTGAKTTPDTSIKTPPRTKTHKWLTDKATTLLRIDWRKGFALLTKTDLEQMERDEEMKRARVCRVYQQGLVSRQVPGVPAKPSH